MTWEDEKFGEQINYNFEKQKGFDGLQGGCHRQESVIRW